MSEFQRALDQYLDGKLDGNSLETALRETLVATPDAAGDLEKTVHDLHADERMEEDVYSSLITRVRHHRTEIIPDAAATAAQSEQAVQSGDAMTGAVFRERFILESEIGQGGMGVVYCARDLRREEAGDRQNKIAIKVLAGTIKNDPDAYIALQREAKRAQQLAHPNIATVYDFDREGDIAYLCMELLEGHPLDQFLATTAAKGLPFDEALPIIKGMANGLAYAHERGIVHADFKPNNVFLTDKGIVKILDFGIARVISQPGRTALTVFDAGRLGAMTPSYASCEMFDRQDPDPRDDIYALACVTYELLTGSHPFSNLAAPQARAGNLKPKPIDGLSTRQNRALQHGLAFARADRTPSAESFLEELTQPRNPAPGWLVGGIGVSVLILMAGTGAWFFLSGEPPVRSTPTETESETANETVNETETATEIETETTPDQPEAANDGEDETVAGQNEDDVREDDASVSTAAASKPIDEATRAKIDRILGIARLHLASGRLVEPPGSNAAEAYTAVIELEPGNRESREGLAAVAAGVEERALELARSDADDEALEIVEQGLKWLPDDPELTRLRDELQK